VDIAYSYAGADGIDVDAFVAAGCRGIVLAAMPPGICAPAQLAALGRAVRRGVIVVFSTRAGCGRVLDHAVLQEHGFIPADNLTPQKARILLMMAIASGLSREQIGEQFGLC
jgi:L-asparaginase